MKSKGFSVNENTKHDCLNQVMPRVDINQGLFITLINTKTLGLQDSTKLDLITQAISYL